MKEYETPEFEIIFYSPEDVFLSGGGGNPNPNVDPDGYEYPIYQP